MAHFALQKLHILPSQLLKMSKRERAFVYASIIVRCQDDKKQIDKLKR